MKILVFANKIVGVNCLCFLLENFSSDEYSIFIPENAGCDLKKMLESKGISYYIINESNLDIIRNLEDRHFDWLLNLWGSYIFKSDIIAKAKKSLNVHPSYLPYGRGMDPIVWSLKERFVAGVTLHSITEKVDAGPIWVQSNVKYDTTTRGEDLYKKCLEEAELLFCDNWERIRSSNSEPFAQYELPGQRTRKRKEFFESGLVNLDADSKLRDFIFHCLAYDFSYPYKLKVQLNNKSYFISLNLDPTDE
jgi:methionyl-tRNA formyltransferase